MSFTELQNTFGLPDTMYYPYLQLRHAVAAQGDAGEWELCPTPVFHVLQSSSVTKGTISTCYQMLLAKYLDAYPCKAIDAGRGDLGQVTEDQWEEALQAIPTCSLNVAQKVSQLYIILRVHYTPSKLHKMGRVSDPICCRCRQHNADLIHLLWRCPKLHRYWHEVISTLNGVFQTTVPVDPMQCLLGVLDEVIPEEQTKVAVSRALFQARKLILMAWKSAVPPSVKMWITHMGKTLIMEKYIYQHRGCPHRFERIWSSWLDTPGLSPRELVMTRLLQGP